jgi:hypothetical protein
MSNELNTKLNYPYRAKWSKRLDFKMIGVTKSESACSIDNSLEGECHSELKGMTTSRIFKCRSRWLQVI